MSDKVKKRRSEKKLLICITPKSKFSSDDWRELGAMSQDLLCQERGWLDEISEKQQAKGVFTISMIPDVLSIREVKARFKCNSFIITARDPESGKLVGFCSVEKKPSLGWATCNGLFVKKEWRGRGTASAFLEMALAEVEKSGLESLDLRVSVKNKAAQALYKKLGFSKTAYELEKWIA